MSSHNVRTLGNGITEITGSTDITVNATIFVKRDRISSVEYRKRFREIRVDIVGRDVPIMLRYSLDVEGDDMLKGLLDCMKDVPGVVEEELEQMRVKEVAARAKIDMMKVQMGELRELLGQIAANTTVLREGGAEERLQDAGEEVETVDADSRAAALIELSEYETLSECEDKRHAEITLVNDTVIGMITMFLICLFLTSGYIYFSRLSMGFSQMLVR